MHQPIDETKEEPHFPLSLAWVDPKTGQVHISETLKRVFERDMVCLANQTDSFWGAHFTREPR